MSDIFIYKSTGKPFQINAREHDVKDTALHLKSSLPEALKNLAIGIVIVILSATILYLVGDKIDSVMADSWIKKTIIAGIVGAIFGLFYFLVVHNFMAVLASLFKPNLKTPEKAVRSFFSSIKKGLHERAYNLLTDNARKLELIEFPVETEMQKEMPDLYFHNFETFENFWSKLGFSWDLDMIRPECKKKDDSLAIVEVEVFPNNISAGKHYFIAEFVLIKKDGYWFLCNGFLWSQKTTEPSLHS